MNKELTDLCIFISCRIEQNNIIPENTPHSVAAGIIYFVSQMCAININKQEVSSISKISEVTLNKCFKKLSVIKNELIPKCLIIKYNIR